MKPGGPLRRTPMRRTVSRNEPTGRVRALVWSRDEGTCVGCGWCIPVGAWWSMQHRKARGQGGSNEPTNLIVLCGSATSKGCHRMAEDRRPEAESRGLWVSAYADPALLPVTYWDGRVAWLTASGGLVYEMRSGLAAVLADEPGDVVVRPDVADGPDDVGWPVALVSGGQDSSAEPDGRRLVGGGRVGELAPGVVIHAGQCLTVKSNGHDPIVRHKAML